MSLTMNLISRTHHSCEMREYAFIVLQEYIIIFLDWGNRKLLFLVHTVTYWAFAVSVSSWIWAWPPAAKLDIWNEKRVRLMCALRTHIKLFIFGNIFSKIEKAVNTFSISEKNFSKKRNYCVPLVLTLANPSKKDKT